LRPNGTLPNPVIVARIADAGAGGRKCQYPPWGTWVNLKGNVQESVKRPSRGQKKGRPSARSLTVAARNESG